MKTTQYKNNRELSANEPTSAEALIKALKCESYTRPITFWLDVLFNEQRDIGTCYQPKKVRLIYAMPNAMSIMQTIMQRYFDSERTHQDAARTRKALYRLASACRAGDLYTIGIIWSRTRSGKIKADITEQTSTAYRHFTYTEAASDDRRAEIDFIIERYMQDSDALLRYALRKLDTIPTDILTDSTEKPTLSGLCGYFYDNGEQLIATGFDHRGMDLTIRRINFKH